ncbi:unnamed protein product, partial [Ectocarpus sp. 13 AM-2016]
LSEQIAAAVAAAPTTSASALTSPEYAPGDVDMLAEMGFDRARVVLALKACSGSVERAAEWLLTGDDDDGGGGVPAGGGMVHGPHLPGGGALAIGQDGDGGGMGWLGGGTELSRIV